jgi:hypothetical protein
MWHSTKQRQIQNQQSYLGEVIEAQGDDIKVNVKHKAGSCWKWPTDPDRFLIELMY